MSYKGRLYENEEKRKECWGQILFPCLWEPARRKNRKQDLTLFLIGLPTGTSGNTLKAPVDAQASVTDERSNVWKYRTDRYGLVTESITALGYVSTVSRNMDGLPVVANDPDPDGTGPMTGSFSMMGYNCHRT